MILPLQRGKRKPDDLKRWLAGNSFWLFSNSYPLMELYDPRLSRDAYHYVPQGTKRIGEGDS